MRLWSHPGEDATRSVGTRWYTCPVLCELRVENLLLIERAELALAPGLNVLTGETGAGKTVLTHALDLLMGGRARGGIVRPGCQEAYVEGVFAVPEHLREQVSQCLPESVRGDLDCEELVLARRVGGEDGRSRAYLNGRAASVADLRELGRLLISFYGQHEHRKLVLASNQLEMLDGVCGPEHAERLVACEKVYREIRELESELERLLELACARERELELLEHELAEIDSLEPEDEEYQALLARRERLRGVETLRMAAGGASEAFVPGSSEGPGASDLISSAAGMLHSVAGIDAALDELAERSVGLAIEAREIAGDLRDYREQIEAEDGSLHAVEERLAAYERLVRKHGGSIVALLEFAESAGARRDELLGAEFARERTDELLSGRRGVLDEHIGWLRASRERAALRLAESVREQLAALAMAQATFEVRLSPVEPKANGADAVEFTIAPNPGVGAAPLREIASGGELSRVMLALASACEDGTELRSPSASTSTLVFDEIDAGIGGHTARAVGERLRELSRRRQIVCITHLPQIASLAARHFTVEKDTVAARTVATVTALTEGEVVTELVRMLGAEERDPAARRHARELRRAA
jgi:DNA repair protein RecN (Recombination protein N)